MAPVTPQGGNKNNQTKTNMKTKMPKYIATDGTTTANWITIYHPFRSRAAAIDHARPLVPNYARPEAWVYDRDQDVYTRLDTPWPAVMDGAVARQHLDASGYDAYAGFDA